MASSLRYCFRALSCPRELDGARLQMRLSFSPTANIFMCVVQLFDCHFAGALGLLRVLVYLTYADGRTTMFTYERKASIRQFYRIIFPSLMQLQGGITNFEDDKQKKICSLRYSAKDDLQHGELSEIDAEREKECAICMEFNSKVVLPNCSHSLCLKCYRDWRSRSQSCPFCRENLKRVNSADLWICPDRTEIVDMFIVWKENLKRLFKYIDMLPLIFPQPVFTHHDSCISCCNVVQDCICGELHSPVQRAPLVRM